MPRRILGMRKENDWIVRRGESADVVLHRDRRSKQFGNTMNQGVCIWDLDDFYRTMIRKLNSPTIYVIIQYNYMVFSLVTRTVQ